MRIDSQFHNTAPFQANRRIYPLTGGTCLLREFSLFGTLTIFGFRQACAKPVHLNRNYHGQIGVKSVEILDCRIGFVFDAVWLDSISVLARHTFRWFFQVEQELSEKNGRPM